MAHGYSTGMRALLLLQAAISMRQTCPASVVVPRLPPPSLGAPGLECMPAHSGGMHSSAVGCLAAGMKETLQLPLRPTACIDVHGRGIGSHSHSEIETGKHTDSKSTVSDGSRGTYSDLGTSLHQFSLGVHNTCSSITTASSSFGAGPAPPAPSSARVPLTSAGS